MTDFHVHIGQFNEVYYDAHEVFCAIESTSLETNVDTVFYSSTSSCRYDVELKKIEEEIGYAQSYKSNLLKVQPYMWYVPKYAEKGITVESALKSFDYVGIKIHPYAQKWDLENYLHKKALNEIFRISTEQKKLILIHTGDDFCCRPSYFADYFRQWPNSFPILAHSRPLDDTLKILKQFPNVKCDVSFCKWSVINNLSKKIKKERMLFGTDFPINNYFDAKKNFLVPNDIPLQYRIDNKIQSIFIQAQGISKNQRLQ